MTEMIQKKAMTTYVSLRVRLLLIMEGITNYVLP